MLNRRKKIQKYINALKSKRQNLNSHHIIKYSLDEATSKRNQQKHPIRTQNEKQILTSYKHAEETYENSENLWEDSDDQQLNISKHKNVFKKLHLSENTDQKQYEGKLKSFYQQKTQIKNWAQVGDGQAQMALNQYLDQQQNYIVQAKSKKCKVAHFARTNQKHESIVSGLDWHNNIMFTCGYDQKLKIFKVNKSQQNTALKIKLQKDVLIQKLPLSNCIYHKGQIYCGTLRKNYVIVDCQKWKTNFVTSSFLSDHSSYQNLRISKEFDQRLIFSKNKISILDYKNSYSGNLLANDELKDVCFGKKQNQVFGVTGDSIYQWDIRTFKPLKIQKTFLAYSKIQSCNDTLVLGSRLGVIYTNQVYINQNQQSQIKPISQIQNMITTITQLKSNKNGSLVLALSKWKPNAGRVIDTKNNNCIGEWPGVKTNFQFGTVGGWSQDDWFSIGSSNGYINIFNFQQ